MKKKTLFYRLLLIVFIASVSFCSVNVPKHQELHVQRKQLENNHKKIKESAKRTNLIQKLSEDPFKDFDYMRPDFYRVSSVK